MSMPASRCLRTASLIDSFTRSSSEASLKGLPSDFAHISSTRSSNLGRLPTWVVRIRSVLRIAVAPFRSRVRLLDDVLQRAEAVDDQRDAIARLQPALLLRRAE